MNNKKYERKTAAYGIIILISVLLLTVFDRITKQLAVVHLKDARPAVLIKGVLELRYLENRGAAWGMLQGQQWIFWIITILFLGLCIFYFIKVPAGKRYLPLTVTIVFLASGALGNFIDRAAQKYVVDFIYFSLIDFPIFNVADIYVSISVIVLIILILFHYKDGDFSFLKKTNHMKEEEV